MKLKIVLALVLSDAVVRDADVLFVRPLPVLLPPPALILPSSSQVFKALHWAYYRAAANPFLKLNTPLDASASTDNALVVGSPQWASFRRRVDEVARASGAVPVDTSS